jgi:hypothetical protein
MERSQRLARHRDTFSKMPVELRFAALVMLMAHRFTALMMTA